MSIISANQIKSLAGTVRNVDSLQDSAQVNAIADSKISTLTNQIGADTGASLVGFKANGVGAVASTVQNKLRESVSVKDFGAVGDGVTDDTAAIQAALNSMPNGGRIFIHQGTYIISGSLFPSSGQSITGLGKVILKKKNADSGAFTMVYMADKTDIIFDGGITFDGNGTNQTASGSSGKALIEVWNNSANISFNDISVVNAYKWGIYLKGSGGVIPKDIKLNGVITSGSLGYVGGVAGADGENGFVIIAGACEATNCTFNDRVDLEANVAGQTIEANFSSCKFFSQLDSGVNGTAGTLTVSGCTFFAKEGLSCARIYGGVFTGNVFTNKYISNTLANIYAGIVVLGNNNYGATISGNTILNASVGIGFAGPIASTVTGNFITCSAVSNGSYTEAGVAFPYGGITCNTTGSVRLFEVTSNQIQVTNAFSTAGGYGIDAQSADCRGVTYTNNAILTDTLVVGKMYVSFSRTYGSVISGNNAIVNTNLTSTLSVVSVQGGYTTVRSGIPTAGTWVLGDTALSVNPTSIGFIGWVCTVGGTPGTWKTFGAVTP